MAHIKHLPQNLTDVSNIRWPIPTTSATNLTAGMAAPFAYVPNDPIVRTIMSMLESKFEFFLGGSRSMVKRGAKVTITKNTDYDFYANDSQEIRKFLSDLEFVANPGMNDYFDDDAVYIVKYIAEQTKIDVVLRKDAKFYREVFESISPEMYAKHLWKSNPECKRENIQPLFNEMFRIAREKKLIETENLSFIQSKVTAAAAVTNEVNDEDDDDNDKTFDTYDDMYQKFNQDQFTRATAIMSGSNRYYER